MLAARCALPGIMARESALHGGDLLAIPGFVASPEEPARVGKGRTRRVRRDHRRANLTLTGGAA